MSRCRLSRTHAPGPLTQASYAFARCRAGLDCAACHWARQCAIAAGSRCCAAVGTGGLAASMAAMSEALGPDLSACQPLVIATHPASWSGRDGTRRRQSICWVSRARQFPLGGIQRRDEIQMRDPNNRLTRAVFALTLAIAVPTVTVALATTAGAVNCSTANVVTGSNFEIDTNANLAVNGASPCIDWLAGGTGTAMRSSVITPAHKPT